MATVITDALIDGGMVEEGGVVKELRRAVLVTGLTGSDWTKMQDALDEADHVSVNGELPNAALTPIVLKLLGKTR